MELRIFTEPQQGASYDDLLAVAQAAESGGFAAFFRSDHFLAMGDGGGLPGPTHAWVTLAGLARDTSTIRLGTLVSPVTFYRPGPLAIMVAQVDEMSGGRVELGIGAGWFEEEHRTHGLEFPPLAERFDLLEEYLDQITGLWATPDGETFSRAGRFHRFDRSPALPKPVQHPGPPIIIGGQGRRRTPALVARYGAEYNMAFAPVGPVRTANERVDSECEAIGRDPAEVVRSVALALCLGTTEAEVTRRAAAIGREPAELRKNGAAGTPDEVRTKLAAYAHAGCERMYLQVLDLSDLDHIALAAAELIAPLSGERPTGG